MSLHDWVEKPDTGQFEFARHLQGVDSEALRQRIIKRLLERLAGIRERMIAGGRKTLETPEEIEAVRLRLDRAFAEIRERERVRVKGVQVEQRSEGIFSGRSSPRPAGVGKRP